MKIKGLFFIMAILVLPGTLMSGITGKIVGRVIDIANGEPLVGVNIVVEDASLGAATDIDGYYVILNVRPGSYTLKATMIGYKNVIQKNVTVLIDLNSTIDFFMEISFLQGEEILVYSREPAVKLDATSTVFRITSDQIEQLQIEEFDDLLSLQAGVYEGHIRGGRSNEVMYIIDGIPMNDVYSGDALFKLDNDMIQQVEVISGTFNAEYGQAMSGIINIVTKEGRKNFEGKVSYFMGNYFSTNRNLYYNIDKFHPTAIQNIKFNLSGPVIGLENKLTFFALGRYYKNDGWIYGQRLFVPGDLSNFSDPENPIIVSTGDGKFVPMNPNQELTLNGKLTYRLSSRDKINIFSLYQKRNSREFDQLFKYNPDGNYYRVSVDYQNSIQFNHVFSPETFVTFNLSQMFSSYGQYVYADSNDSRYVPLYHLTGTGATGFSTGGMRMWQHRRSNLTNIAKMDFTSQITRQQKIDFGVIFKSYKLRLHEKYLYFDENNSLRTAPRSSSYNNAYTHSPYEIAAYIQDKIEIGEMIINAGLRYDFFNPDGVVLDQYYDTRTANRIKARSSSQVSPRFGIAYPISDEGVIHFSYGHFFQVPNFEYLYVNPEFEVSLIEIVGDQPPRGRFNAMGNAELKPRKTIQYELGFKQALTSDLTIELTGFNKDSRDLIGQETRNDVYGGKFWRFINTDYANAKGVTVALEQLQRSAGSFGFSIDYTYQVVTGNASDPNDEWLNQGQDPPIQGEKKRQPLDWDQTHSLNTSVTTTQNGLHISLIGRLGTGTPYTRSSPRYSNRIKNGERKPMTMTIDLNITKDIHLGGRTLHPYLKIYNLLDARNNKEVFNSSGSAEYSYEMNFQSYIGIRTQKEYFTRPDYYYEPRRINVGISFGF